MSDNHQQLIHSFARSQSEKVLMAVRKFKGRHYLDLRIWFQTKDDPTLRPTKKGISFLLDYLPELQQGVERLLKARSKFVDEMGENHEE